MIHEQGQWLSLPPMRRSRSQCQPVPMNGVCPFCRFIILSFFTLNPLGGEVQIIPLSVPEVCKFVVQRLLPVVFYLFFLLHPVGRTRQKESSHGQGGDI